MKVAWSGERAVERNDCVQGIFGKSNQLNLSTEAEEGVVDGAGDSERMVVPPSQTKLMLEYREFSFGPS